LPSVKDFNFVIAFGRNLDLLLPVQGEKACVDDVREQPRAETSDIPLQLTSSKAIS
jgi:hypothetical protein